MTFAGFWLRQSLANRFALAGGAVLLVSAVLIGGWVTSRIERAVVRNTANATAQYMESFISPLSQEIDSGEGLSSGARRSLEEIFDGTSLGARVVSFKLWNQKGVIVEASDKSIVGKSYPLNDKLERALAGEVAATFEDLNDDESAGERALGIPLLEIYSPIREAWSGRIIGVAEFYEAAGDLQRDLALARLTSWIAVVSVLLVIGAALYTIVLQGSRTIDRQSRELNAQLLQLRRMYDRNAKLRRTVQQAAGRAAAMNDQTLRRVGADLHDGPAQLMSFAALRLDSLRKLTPDGAAQAEIDAVGKSVADAIGEIRQISRGLSLPDIESRAPCDIVRSVAEAHRARTGSPVDVTCDLPDGLELSGAVKICLYRFAQEGLNNGWRHGGGKAQALHAECPGQRLKLSVLDRGPGFAAAGTSPSAGIGLSGLRDRVESLGGTMTTGNRDDGPGARLTMELDLEEA